eukprot:7387986-Prymnesium_polylepis.1
MGCPRGGAYRGPPLCRLDLGGRVVLHGLLSRPGGTSICGQQQARVAPAQLYAVMSSSAQTMARRRVREEEPFYTIGFGVIGTARASRGAGNATSFSISQRDRFGQWLTANSRCSRRGASSWIPCYSSPGMRCC